MYEDTQCKAWSQKNSWKKWVTFFSLYKINLDANMVITQKTTDQENCLLLRTALEKQPNYTPLLTWKGEKSDKMQLDHLKLSIFLPSSGNSLVTEG